MSKHTNRILGIALVAVPILLTGCGAGSAQIPAVMPHPRKMSDVPGKGLADIAKAKGMDISGQPPVQSKRGFNPTNPTN